jgi:hypothetical protein
MGAFKMMCCQKCPFHPTLGYSDIKCAKPLCNVSIEDNFCHDSLYCYKSLGSACFMDNYVIENLRHNDELAVQLASYTLKTALLGRNRSLLLSLFASANITIRKMLWHSLKVSESRSLWLLNPVFVASGLPALEGLNTTAKVRNRYLSAISGSLPIYSVQSYKNSISKGGYNTIFAR